MINSMKVKPTVDSIDSTKGQIIKYDDNDHLQIDSLPPTSISAVPEQESCSDKFSGAFQKFKRGCRCKRGFKMDIFDKEPVVANVHFQNRLRAQRRRLTNLQNSRKSLSQSMKST